MGSRCAGALRSARGAAEDEFLSFFLVRIPGAEQKAGRLESGNGGATSKFGICKLSLRKKSGCREEGYAS